jgi:hypothetical protein
MLSLTAKKAIDAYGGIDLWQNSKYIEAEVSVKGLLFILKRRPYFERSIIKIDINRPFSKLMPIGNDKNIIGVLDGLDVRLEDSEGKIIASRKNARDYFPYRRRLLYWDDMDMAYFANYAFWNYLTFPNLLLNNDILWREKKEGILEATFPDSIPSHSKIQEYKIDLNTGRLIQQNYTAMVVSKLATAANLVINHSEDNGIVYPSKRLITPQSKNGDATRWPVLIDIEIHKFKLSTEKL